MKKMRVWDLPIRLFHWALAVAVITALVTEKIGGNAIEWHFRFGYLALALVGFRLLWGVIGTRYARFSNFLHAPSAILAFVSSRKGVTKEKHLGHTPLGGLSVFAMLGVIVMQTASGLFANDDIASEGPLAKFISKDVSDKLSWFHAQVSGNLIYALVGLHVAAIIYYYVRKKEDLIIPMITGDKISEGDALAANDSWQMRLRAFICIAACAAGVYYLVNL
ncbi:cytochrome b/b6 domain-containing protein [Undibacterium arcticum]|uniref:Cytochrome b/b6 domain-containing protein n=2 Tax=Undibacterium arcticum TaxID=1762892 RepID=A0ABV7F3L8_9BURK